MGGKVYNINLFEVYNINLFYGTALWFFSIRPSTNLDPTAGHAVPAARLLVADGHGGGEGGKVRVRIRELRKF